MQKPGSLSFSRLIDQTRRGKCMVIVSIVIQAECTDWIIRCNAIKIKLNEIWFINKQKLNK